MGAPAGLPRGRCTTTAFRHHGSSFVRRVGWCFGSGPPESEPGAGVHTKCNPWRGVHNHLLDSDYWIRGRAPGTGTVSAGPEAGGSRRPVSQKSPFSPDSAEGRWGLLAIAHPTH